MGTSVKTDGFTVFHINLLLFLLLTSSPLCSFNAKPPSAPHNPLITLTLSLATGSFFADSGCSPAITLKATQCLYPRHLATRTNTTWLGSSIYTANCMYATLYMELWIILDLMPFIVKLKEKLARVRICTKISHKGKTTRNAQCHKFISKQWI